MIITSDLNDIESATSSRAEGMRKAPKRGRDHALLAIADLSNSLHKPPAMFRFRSIIPDLAVTVEPLQFSPAEPEAYEGSYKISKIGLVEILGGRDEKYCYSI